MKGDPKLEEEEECLGLEDEEEAIEEGVRVGLRLRLNKAMAIARCSLAAAAQHQHPILIPTCSFLFSAISALNKYNRQENSKSHNLSRCYLCG